MYKKILYISLFFFLLFFQVLYGYADTENSVQEFEVKEILTPFAYYARFVMKEDLNKLTAENDLLPKKLKCITNSSYIEKEFLKPIIASYIAIYSIKDIAYIFITGDREIKPVYKTSYTLLFKGKEPNYLGIEYDTGYIKENAKLYKNVDIIKIEKDGKAIIVSKKGVVLSVKGFRFLSGEKYFIYTSFNPINLEFNKKNVYKSSVKYILFSPYY